MGSLQQVLHSLQSTLFNIWQLALQLSHEILKTALPLYIKNSPLIDKLWSFSKEIMLAGRTEVIVEGHHFIKYVCNESVILNG